MNRRLVWDRELSPVILTLLLLKRFLNIQDLYVSQVVIKDGA